MEINVERVGSITELRAVGRLDAYWADHLTGALEALIRTGQHQVVLRMEGIEFISSIGIRVLVSAYKNFRAVAGTFTVAGPDENVERVLRMAGLSALMAQSAASVLPVMATAEPRVQIHAGLRVEVHPLSGVGMSCSRFGDSAGLRGTGFAHADCHSLQIGPDLVSIGLGAFGADFEQCRNRFGEYLALAGAAAYQPGDGSNACDALISTGDYQPEVQALYGLKCQGGFSQLLRFEPDDDQADDTDTHGSVGQLVALALESAQAPAACLVIIGESAGLVGASLRRSPAARAPGEDPLAFPEVRTWLSVTSERVHVGASVVACGVVARAGALPRELADLLRPVGTSPAVEGHLHAAVFRYRPLQRGLLELRKTLQPLFEDTSPEGVMHLLTDDRDPDGAIESRIIRGACWVAPITGGAA
jgi:anti-anti-sigma factor